MSRNSNLAAQAHPVSQPGGSLTVIRGPCTRAACVLYLEGALRLPLDGMMRRQVRALLDRGERMIVLNLSGVSKIDAAGVGELVETYKMAQEVKGLLQIVHATAWVRHILELVGLFEILSEGRPQTRHVIREVSRRHSSRASRTTGISGSAPRQPSKNRS
jgi:anti-anti-sigma factor